MTQVQTTNAYLQVKRYLYKKNAAATTTYWVQGSELQSIALAAGVGCSWITTGQYLCMQGGTPPSGGTDYVAGTVYGSSTPSPGAPPLTLDNGNFYAVSVNGNGDIVGVAQYPNNQGGAVHASCWTSFIPH